MEALACGCRLVVNEYDNMNDILSDEAISSGYISIVKMPRMKTIDTPYLEDIPAYIERLEMALLHQIELSKQDVINDRYKIINLVRNTSWNNIFRKVNEISETLINQSKL